MSYVAGQVVHVNGEKFTVASSYKSGSTVPLLNSLKQLTLVSKDKISGIPVGITKAWAYTKGKVVIIYNSSKVADGTTAIIHEQGDYTLSTINVCTATGDIVRVEKEHLYNPPPPAKPLAKDAKLSVEQRIFISILIEPSREVVIKSVLDGVDLSLYDEYKGDKYYVLVPKKIDKKAPMLMAHTDIQRGVSHPTWDNLEYDKDTQMFSSPTGLGADDRAGCYAIHKALINHPGKFIVALFDEEEIGCIGSKDFVTTDAFKVVDSKASCYISIDRRRGFNGVSEIATYDFDNTDLFKLIELATGRKTTKGSSTDCRQLSDKSYTLKGAAKLACFNMSCGYSNEHQKSEVQYWKELEAVVTDLQILVDYTPELWEMAYPATKKTYPTYTKPTYTTPKYNYEETIEIDGEIFDSTDVTLLLALHKQAYGCNYEFQNSTYLLVEPEIGDCVRLSRYIKSEGTYGGKYMSADLYENLSKDSWVVSSVRKDTCHMVGSVSDMTATFIPSAWLEIIEATEPIIEKDK